MANANIRTHFKEEELWWAVGMVQRGANFRQVGTRLVSAIRHHQSLGEILSHGTSSRRFDGGRKRVKTPAQDRFLVV
jgi:hypothetical protein